MPPAVRLSDKAMCPADAHGCPACPHPTVGPAVNGSTNVFVNKLPAIRLGDPGIHMACCGANQWKVAKGSSTVYVNGKPIARMGDKTTHCGGSGNLINGSPNVFIDDGALAGMKGKLNALKDGEARDGQHGKHDGKDKDNKGNWKDKTGKGKNKKGGKGDDPKDKDHDHSKDADEKNSDHILSVSLDQPVAAPGKEVKFTVECGAKAVGSIKVEVFVRTGDNKELSLTKTSVEAKLEAHGSFKMPSIEWPSFNKKYKFVLENKKFSFFLKATLKDKTVESKDGHVGDLGEITLFLYDERMDAKKPKDTDGEPNNNRKDSTVLVDEPVDAEITIEGYGEPFKVHFDAGETFIGSVNPPEGPGDGKAYDEKTVSVKILTGKYKDYKAVAFAPPSRHSGKKSSETKGK